MENFVSEKKVLGKVLQSIIPIIYLIGSISIAHWRLFLQIVCTISFNPHFLLYQTIFYSIDNLDNFSTLEGLPTYCHLRKNDSQGRWCTCLYNHGGHSVMKKGILLTRLGIVPRKNISLPGNNQVKNV